MAGRKPITAIHCAEYTANASESVQGPPACTVSSSRPDQFSGEEAAGDAMRFVFAGTPSTTHAAAAADTSDSAHHQPGQPAHAISAGPSSSARATPSGM